MKGLKAITGLVFLYAMCMGITFMVWLSLTDTP